MVIVASFPQLPISEICIASDKLSSDVGFRIYSEGSQGEVRTNDAIVLHEESVVIAHE
jgi:hypothetical protein